MSTNTIFFYFFIFLSQNLFPVNAQYQQALDAGGTTTYLSTTVVVLNPLPTIIYNCGIMPAICNNVKAWATAQGRALPLTLHYDPNTARKNRRGNTACPGTWRTTHPCPEANQPAVHAFDLTNAATMAQYATGLLTPNMFTNEIAGVTAQDSSGLGYTCDEFPARSFIEGGTFTGAGGTVANTYCAPQGVSCASSFWNTVKDVYKGVQGAKYPYARGEQNWQSTVHSHLASYARLKHAQKVLRFQLQLTTIVAAAIPNAATLIVPGVSSKTVTKRDEHEATGVPDLEAEAWFNESRAMSWEGVTILTATLGEMEKPQATAPPQPTYLTPYDEK